MSLSTVVFISQVNIVILVGINYISICTYNILTGELRWERNVENLTGNVGTYAEFTTLCRLNKNCYSLLLGTSEEVKIFRIKFEMEDQGKSPYTQPGVDSQGLSNPEDHHMKTDDFKRSKSVKLRRNTTSQKKETVLEMLSSGLSKVGPYQGDGVPIVIDKPTIEIAEKMINEPGTALPNNLKNRSSIAGALQDGARRYSEAYRELISPGVDQQKLNRKKQAEKDLAYYLSFEGRANDNDPKKTSNEDLRARALSRGSIRDANVRSDTKPTQIGQFKYRAVNEVIQEAKNEHGSPDSPSNNSLRKPIDFSIPHPEYTPSASLGSDSLNNSAEAELKGTVVDLPKHREVFLITETPPLFKQRKKANSPTSRPSNYNTTIIPLMCPQPLYEESTRHVQVPNFRFPDPSLSPNRNMSPHHLDARLSASSGIEILSKGSQPLPSIPNLSHMPPHAEEVEQNSYDTHVKEAKKQMGSFVALSNKTQKNK